MAQSWWPVSAVVVAVAALVLSAVVGVVAGWPVAVIGVVAGAVALRRGHRIGLAAVVIGAAAFFVPSVIAAFSGA